MRTDRELLTAIADGDRAALATLYERHAAWLTLRLAQRCDDRGHVAQRAVGLPGGFRYVQQGPDGTVTSARPCVQAGQARESVLLWLAARSDPAAAGALREAAAEQPYPGSGAADGAADTWASPWLDLWTPTLPTIAASWSQTGADVALQCSTAPMTRC